MRKNLELKVETANELMKFLIEKLDGQSRNNIKTLLAHDQITVNEDHIRQFNHELKVGDVVGVNFTASREIKVNKTSKGIKVIFEDNDIVAIEKDSGMLSISTDKEREKTAYSMLKDYLKNKNPLSKVFIVHRLDRETSGVMIFAKSEEIQQKLQANWNEYVVERKYVALVEGTVKNDEGVVKSYLKENSAFVTYSCDTDKDGGKLAITNYKVLKRAKGMSMLEFDIETGRKNQIRVHMKDIGHSIVGDKKYGA
ncbi:MAG: RluA family pseudouridine synthase, partial [Fusobacteriaceae bacterium]